MLLRRKRREAVEELCVGERGSCRHGVGSCYLGEGVKLGECEGSREADKEWDDEKEKREKAVQRVGG